jgi:hypothetical protein
MKRSCFFLVGLVGLVGLVCFVGSSCYSLMAMLWEQTCSNYVSDSGCMPVVGGVHRSSMGDLGSAGKNY